ncbi:MAG: ATP-binding protein [Bacteroidales bacterium]|nr:ATP-binding protein [Bacteroidales bacterium]
MKKGETKIYDKRALELILTEQKEELADKASEFFCKRKEQSLIDLKSSQAQVVIGVRRSGKSTLCYQALQEAGVAYAYADFDDERLVGLAAVQLNDVLEVLYKIYGDVNYLFLDEIQNVEGWHLFVNRMLRKKVHVVITGSNAKLLSVELATHLSGRCKEINLYPLSFSEYCVLTNTDTHTLTTKAKAFRRKAFDDYMRQGGFPELFAMDDKSVYVRGLVENVLKRDIEQRYKISYKSEFEQLAHHLLNVSPTTVVAKDLAENFRFKSEHTATNYIGYLKQAYILLGLQKFSRKSKSRSVLEKVYAVDVAMMNQRDNAFAGDNLGWRLETLVMIHLTRKCKLEGLDLYYYKDNVGECDFIVCKGNKTLQAIQVSYDISNEKTRKREIKGLKVAAKATQCDNLLLLTDHERDLVEDDGHRIQIQPFYEWSLE